MNEQYYENPEFNTPTVSPSSVLTFGILALALLAIPYIGCIPSLIFAIMARKKAKKFGEETGTTCGMVNTGRILGTVGLILSLISLCSAALYIAYIVLVYVLMILGVAASSTYCIMPFLF